MSQLVTDRRPADPSSSSPQLSNAIRSLSGATCDIVTATAIPERFCARPPLVDDSWKEENFERETSQTTERQESVLSTGTKGSMLSVSSLDDLSSVSPADRLRRLNAPRFQFLVESYDGSSVEEQITCPDSSSAFSDIDNQSHFTSVTETPSSSQSSPASTAATPSDIQQNDTRTTAVSSGTRKLGQVIRRRPINSSNGSNDSSTNEQEERKTVKAFVSGLMRAPSWNSLSSEGRTIEEVSGYVFRNERSPNVMKHLAAPARPTFGMYASSFGVGLVGGTILFSLFRLLLFFYGLLFE